MARGKQTCKILKEIRRQIAEANGIEFATSECRYKGDCLGTCPKCEAEVRYLEQQLRARSLTGKAVALAGISAGMIFMSGCSGTSTKPQANDKILGETISDTEMVEEVEELSTIKEGVSASEEDTTTIRLRGEVCDIDIVPSYREEKKAYDIVDEYPEFPGGDAGMMRCIYQNLKYPEEQLMNGIQGTVLVRFYVDTFGCVCEPEIVRSKHPALDQEALRVVQLFPKIAPGMLDGKPVNTYMIVPIKFRLPAD
ncbi:MAG: energy transducer TonB [Muribaculaceae bacterium]|nr:energy transducer TonB [Muribaculaceae bacterium]